MTERLTLGCFVRWFTVCPSSLSGLTWRLGEASLCALMTPRDGPLLVDSTIPDWSTGEGPDRAAPWPSRLEV